MTCLRLVLHLPLFFVAANEQGCFAVITLGPAHFLLHRGKINPWFFGITTDASAVTENFGARTNSCFTLVIVQFVNFVLLVAAYTRPHSLSFFSFWP